MRLAFFLLPIVSYLSEKWLMLCSTCLCSFLTWASHSPHSSDHSSVHEAGSWWPGSYMSTSCHCHPWLWPCRSQLQTQPTTVPWQSGWCRCSPRKLMKQVSALQVTKYIKACESFLVVFKKTLVRCTDGVTWDHSWPIFCST